MVCNFSTKVRKRVHLFDAYAILTTKKMIPQDKIKTFAQEMMKKPIDWAKIEELLRE